MTPERYQQQMKIFDAVLDHPVEQRDEVLSRLCAGDPDLHSEVQKLLADQSEVAGFLEHSPLEAFTDAQLDSMIGRRIGPYRVMEAIGRGGMGAVYKAVRDDDEYQTEVAIKLIKRGMDTDYVLRRFRSERQILANLNHPNIARLVDGGTTEEGLPFFVMEFIQGETIDEYCNREDLSPAARLELFCSVCAAVSYAHQNLVIHRDLKPSNILVTKDGTVKLLDFGIAKLLHPEADKQTLLTATELRVMTPDYASPEQIMGAPITTVSDVYSLGVVLCELLTGRRPFTFKNGNRIEIARLICEAEPSKPSRLLRNSPLVIKREESNGKIDTHGTERSISAPNGSRVSSPPAFDQRQLKGDLDAIVLMALRKEPERRYSSVEQLSEDIKRHLDGLPVMAHEDSFSYRSTKFIRRHKSAVIAAAIVAVAILAGMLTTLWQARKARAERARAERRFNDVRGLANSLMFELNDQIAKEPTKARELLVMRALQYLDGLAQEAGDDSALQRELATAYQKVGDVQSELHAPNVGDSQSAAESYRKALSLREQLWMNAAKDFSLGLELAASYNRMGDILSKTGFADKALANYRKAQILTDHLLTIEPENIAVRRESERTHIALGRALLKTSSLAEVLEAFRKAVGISESLASQYPANPELQFELAKAYETLGYALTETGEVQNSLALYRKALGINEALLSGDPANARRRRAVFDSNWWVGVALTGTGESREALIYHRRALAIAIELSDADAGNIQARNDLADAYMETAKTLTQANNASEALKHFQKAIENYDSVWASDKRNAHARRQIYYTHLYMGEAQAHAGDLKGAVETLQRTVTAFEEILQSDPANAEIENDLATSYLKLGEALLLKGDAQSALTNLNRALPMLEKLARQSPQNTRKASNLALVYLALGNAGVKRETPHAARDESRLPCSWYRKSVDQWRSIESHGTLEHGTAIKRDEAYRQQVRCQSSPLS